MTNFPRDHFNYGTEQDLSSFYPIESQADIDSLGACQIVSPMVGDMLGFTDPAPVGSDQHTQEHEDLERLRLCIGKGQWPEWWLKKYNTAPRLSTLLIRYANNILTPEQHREQGALNVSEQTPALCAEIVKMDHPFQLWDDIITPYMADEGIGIRPDISKHAGLPFVEGVAVRAHAHLLILKGLYGAFKMKSYLGQARPSEFNPAGRDIEQFDCPNHPSKPAGHGGFCGATAKAFELYTNANAAQKKLVYDTCLQTAQLRSFAGVHIPSDNRLGFDWGYSLTIDEFFGDAVLSL